MPRTYNEVDALVSKEAKILKNLKKEIATKQDKMVYSVTDIKAIPQDICNKLKVGDTVNKGNHSYRVSFKKDTEGMCLTYVDASRVETQSYDLISNVWTYNSEDLTEFEDYAKKTELPPTVVANPTLAGTEPNLEGLDVGGEKYAIPQGSKLYVLKFYYGSQTYTGLSIITSKVNNITELKNYLNSKGLTAALNGIPFTNVNNQPSGVIFYDATDDVVKYWWTGQGSGYNIQTTTITSYEI